MFLSVRPSALSQLNRWTHVFGMEVDLDPMKGFEGQGQRSKVMAKHGNCVFLSSNSRFYLKKTEVSRGQGHQGQN